MPFNFSTGEILVFLVVAVLVFGGRLPGVARKFARGVGDFRRGMNEELRRIDVGTGLDDEPPAEWKRPPDGADCDGFGRIAPQDGEAPEEDAGEPDPPSGS